MSGPLVVVALGGNALLRRGEPAEAETQRRNVLVAASALAGLADDHRLVVTHGNSPQVGLLALESDAYKGVAPYPLDVLGAESQGMIGYLLVQALRNALGGRDVVGVLTQVIVRAHDPAFEHPTKRIGPVYSEPEARRLEREHGWSTVADGIHRRRVVPSPQPEAIVEAESIARLVGDGAVVVCAGGGGIPVADANGALRGVEAVIDKDLTAALLAESLGADRLVLATDVPAVEVGWRTASAERIGATTPAELRRFWFPPESMGPKVEAACGFVERTGGTAAIGALADLREVVRGGSGTQIEPARALAAAP